MKSPMVYALLIGALLLPFACNHPQSTLIDTGGQEVEDENVLEITFALPNRGPTEGGMTIAVVGKYFHPGTEVFLDGTVCDNIQVVSSGYIQCEIPAHAAGQVDLRVDDPVTSLSCTVTNGFTYSDEPFLTAVSPNSGTATGGTNVRIYGFNFDTAATVDFDATAAASATVVSSRQIDCVTPAGTIGPVDVTVTNPPASANAGTVTLANGYTYTYPPPDPQSITPNTGDNMGGTDVTITGDWFVTGASVKIGTNNCTNVVVQDANTITCTTPPGPVYSPAQAVDVLVTNPDGQSGLLQPGFTYFYVNPAPTVISVTPTSGFSQGGSPVTIDGTGFFGNPTVQFGLSNASNVVLVSSTRLTAVTPGGSGTVNVTVTNPDTQSDTLTNGYTFIGGGGGGTPGSIIIGYSPDSTANCDWWYLDFLSYNTSYTTALVAAGLSTNGATPAVDALAHDLYGGQILETSSVAYLRNTNGTGVSGQSFNICFLGDPSHITGLTLGTHYSRMCYGNSDPSSSGALGRAIVDPTPTANPHNMEDNDYGNQLGIFVGELVSAYGSLPGGALTANDQTYVDGTYVYGTGNDTRYNQIRNYIQQLGMRTGFVNSHETGHSVGLVHYDTSKCIMNTALNISGNFTNTTYYFSTHTRGLLTTYLGITPTYAREQQTLHAMARGAALVVRAAVTGAEPMGPEGFQQSRLTASPLECLKGEHQGQIRVMAETHWSRLPAPGEEVLLFLSLPDTERLPYLEGHFTLAAGGPALLALRSPEELGAMASAEVYADPARPAAERAARLLLDFRMGGFLRADAVVALSRNPELLSFLSAEDRNLLVRTFADAGQRSALANELTHYILLLGRLGDEKALPHLLALLSEPASAGQGRNLAEALGRIDGEAAASAVARTLAGEETALLVRKLRLLGFLRASSAYGSIEPYTASDDDAVRRAALVAAGKTGGDPAETLLRSVLFDEESPGEDVRCAVVALSFLPDKKGIPALEEAEASHPDEEVRGFVRAFRRDAASYRFAIAGE